MPVIVLAGEEEFTLNRRVAELKSKLLSPAWQTVNFVKLNNANISVWQDAAATLPFGSGNRVVLVDNCDLFTKKRGKSAVKDDDEADNKKNKRDGLVEDQFELSLKTIPENTYLIFSCPYNFDSSLKLSKLVSKLANLEEFPKEKYFPGSRNPRLESWCRQEAKKYSATIDDAAIQYLLNSTEANLRQLASEIEKTALAIMPKTAITYEVVSKLCSSQGHVFQFVDLWLNGQIGQALDNLKEILAQQNFMPVLATLQTMLSKWIKLKILYEKYSANLSGTNKNKLSLNEIAKQIAAELKLMPFSVEKDLRRLQKYSASQLINKRIQLTRLEYAIKTGLVPGEHALTMFVSSN